MRDNWVDIYHLGLNIEKIYQRLKVKTYRSVITTAIKRLIKSSLRVCDALIRERFTKLCKQGFYYRLEEPILEIL